MRGKNDTDEINLILKSRSKVTTENQDLKDGLKNCPR